MSDHANQLISMLAILTRRTSQIQGVAITPREIDMFQRLDLVRLANGSEMIVTDIKRTRPANPYVGVKPRGNGRQYKFGPKHGPEKIGTVDESHPALIALSARTGGVSPQMKALLESLFDAVEAGDLEKAAGLAPLCRSYL